MHELFQLSYLVLNVVVSDYKNDPLRLIPGAGKSFFDVVDFDWRTWFVSTKCLARLGVRLVRFLKDFSKFSNGDFWRQDASLQELLSPNAFVCEVVEVVRRAVCSVPTIIECWLSLNRRSYSIGSSVTQGSEPGDWNSHRTRLGFEP